jgi:nicotinate-nucleotide adenylyltransferase
MNFGIFGGTFDPPHLGHLILAADARFQLGLNQILWVLTPAPPHKPRHQITSLDDRIAMLEAAILDAPDFSLSRVDIDRSPPYYAVDTVQILRKAHPQARLVYLMGGDSLQDLPAWVRPQEFLQACDAVGVMRRPGDLVDVCALEERLPGLAAKCIFLETPQIDISSTTIRRRAACGEPFRYFVAPPVFDLIQERCLYRS